MVKTCLAGGADPALTDKQGNTALTTAARQFTTSFGGKPYDVEIVRMLLEHGASPNHRNHDGASAFMFAVHSGHKEFVQLLYSPEPDAFTPASPSGHRQAKGGLLDRLNGLFGKKSDGEVYEEKKLTEVLTEPPPIIQAVIRGDEVQARALIAAKVDVNVEDSCGRGALEWAAILDRLKIAEALLAIEGESALSDEKKAIALKRAVQEGTSKISALLIAAGKDPNAGDRGYTALYEAVKEGHIDIVKDLVEAGADINHSPEGYWTTPIYEAVQNGHLEVVRYLIAKGANIQGFPYGNQNTSLLTIAAENGQAEVCRILLENGVSYTSWALIEAAERGHLEIVRQLAAHARQSDLNEAFRRSMATYYHEFDRLEAAKVFLELGASPDCGALEIASDKGMLEVVWILLKAKALPTEEAIWETSRAGHVQILEALLEAVSDSNERRSFATSSLMTASNYGHLKVVQALIGAGAEVDCHQDRSNETPLMVASSLGDLQVAQELLHAGADRSLKNKNGQTALDLAREHGHLEVVDLLRGFSGGSAGKTEAKTGVVPGQVNLTN
jgi:ankyrin repeat domain-containing protein 17